MKRILIGTVLLCLLATGVTWVMAEGVGTILACGEKDGTLRLVADPAECKTKETVHRWYSLERVDELFSGLQTDMSDEAAARAAADGDLQGQIDELASAGPDCDLELRIKAAVPGFQASPQCGPIPVDCAVSEWSPWAPCSASCGGGTMARTRNIVESPANGGAACPALEETQSCNTEPCPVDCVVSAWSPWTPCSAPCDGGTMTRSRTIVETPANGGAACPALQETQPCNTEPCTR